MNSTAIQNWYEKHRTACVIVVIAAATVFAMAIRRPDQWAAPYVWVEDGQQMLPDFIANGWRCLLHPINGYYILPSRFIGALSAAISFLWLPQVEYWLTLMFSAAVLCAVALSPTQLRYRVFCALGVLALPTDSEVYGVSSLAFWWGSLLAILPLLWRNDGRQYPLLRSGMLVIGGLSSPLLIALMPLYALRAAWLRTRSALLDLCVAILVGAVQWSVMPPTQVLSSALAVPPLMFVRKFFGYFIYVPAARATHEGATLFAGIVFLALLVLCVWRFRRELRPAAYFLFAGFLLAAFAATLRLPLFEIHPFVAGPRYFFLPFSMLLWAMLQLLALDAPLPRLVTVAVMALVARNALDGGQRDSDHFDWQANVRQCVQSEQHEFPISYDGRAVAAWKITISGDDCRRMVAASWFGSMKGNVP